MDGPEIGLTLARLQQLPYGQIGGAGVLTLMAALEHVFIERMKNYRGLQV